MECFFGSISNRILGLPLQSHQNNRSPSPLGPTTSVSVKGLDFVQFLTLHAFPIITRHIAASKLASDLAYSTITKRKNNTKPKQEGHLGWSLLYATNLISTSSTLLQFYPKEHLHASLTRGTSLSEKPSGEHWRGIVASILHHFLPESEYTCPIFSTLVREVLVCKLIQPLIAKLSDPEFWLIRFNNLADSFIFQKQDLLKKIAEAMDKQSLQDEAFFSKTHGTSTIN